MYGRRIRRARPEKITRINRVIQEINESIIHCGQLLDSKERSVFPGDWLRGTSAEPDQLQTWRTVGCLNLTDHFLARYLERVMGVSFDMNQVAQYFSPVDRVTQSMRLKYAITERTDDYIESDLFRELEELKKRVVFDPKFLSNAFSRHPTLRYNFRHHDFYVVMYLVGMCLLPKNCLMTIMYISNDQTYDLYVARSMGEPLMITLSETDHYKVRFAYDTGIITDEVKTNIRDFVKTPPEHCRVVRKENRVITVLV